MDAIKNWGMNRVVRPIKDVVQGGISPRNLAFSVALGVVAGGCVCARALSVF